MEQLRPLVAPVAAPDVQALADVEKLKAELKKQADDNKLQNEQQMLAAEAVAEQEQTDQETRAALVVQDAKHQDTMAEIAAKNAITDRGSASKPARRACRPLPEAPRSRDRAGARKSYPAHERGEPGRAGRPA
jgi:hypothetical protein